MKIRVRTTIRRRIFSLGLFLSLLGVIIVTLLFIGPQRDAYASANGEYQSRATGNWSGTTTWQKYGGGSWGNTVTPPTSIDKVITILNGHTITVTANVTVDQLIVNAGGTLILNSGVTLTINNGTATDLDVSGTFNNAGIVTISSGATIVYQNGGKYQHNFTTSAGTIPTATWSTGSTCEIIGYTNCNTPPSNLQSFDNFTWSCPSQTQDMNLNGGLTTVNGDFTVTSTGGNQLRLSNNGSTIGIGGDYIQSGGYFTLGISSNSTSNMNIAGNFSLSGGTFSVIDGSNSVGNVNISGNYSHTGGTLTEGGNHSITSGGVFSFVASASHTFTSSGGAISNNIDYTVSSGSTLTMGTNAVSGRNFTLASGATLAIGSSNGITSTEASGNVQSSGTRTFSTSGNYTYNGSSIQSTGSGLPATVNNLSINNSSGVNLTNTVSVSGILNFQSGKFFTSTNEIKVTNTSTSSITGNSNTSYVSGKLRRSVSGSGTYDFPVGTDALSELMSVTLASVIGVSNMVCSFVNSNPNDTVNSLSVIVSGVTINEMLNYGYWTLTPNALISSGTFTVTGVEQGYSNVFSNGMILSLMSRLNASSSWQSIGTHNDNTQSVNAGVVTAARSAMNIFYQFGIGLGAYATFSSPSLQSGTAGAVGAVYLFQDILRNVDAWISINSIYNGASLSEIDNSTVGYSESFQPFITFPALKDSYIEWKFRFKVANTATDTVISKINATGVDIDGGYNDPSNKIQEYIQATMPTSYALDAATTLTVTNDSGFYKAKAATTNISNIDTSRHDAMYQMNYNNVNSFTYRTGSVNGYSTAQTRQTSVYFKSFLTGSPVYALPIKLVFFNAKIKDDKVELTWKTASETNNDYFTIERSLDGENFEPLLTKKGAGNSTFAISYNLLDENPPEEYAYYRLKQTDYDGKFTYSKIKVVHFTKEISGSTMEVNTVSPNPFTTDFSVSYSIKSIGNVEFTIINFEGKIIEQKTLEAQEGNNSYDFIDNYNLSPGIYFLSLTSGDQKIVKKLIKN